MKSVPPLVAAIAAALFVPAAGAQAQAPQAQSPRQCFFAREVNRWSDAGGNAVDLRISSRETYRLTLFAPCPELRSALSIGLDPQGGSASVCEGDRNVTLVVQDASRQGTVRCPIDSVRRLSPDEGR